MDINRGLNVLNMSVNDPSRTETMTTRRDLSVRIAVGDPLGRRSAIWRIFSVRAELYAAHRAMGGIEKISFHSSRICRRAFVGAHPLPSSMSDRVLQRWQRAQTPPAGEGKVAFAMSIIFPEGHLSLNLPTTSKQTIWAKGPAMGKARIIRVVFSHDNRAEVQRLLDEEAGQQMLAYHSLPSGEAVVIQTWENAWSQPDLIVPASHHETEDFVFPAQFEPEIARKEALTIYTVAEELRCIELTGYRVPAGEARVRFPHADTFSRNEVVDTAADTTLRLAHRT